MRLNRQVFTGLKKTDAVAVRVKGLATEILRGTLRAVRPTGRAGRVFGRGDVKFPVATAAMVRPHAHYVQENIDKLLARKRVDNLPATARA